MEKRYRIVQNRTESYEMLRNVTKCYGMLRNVTESSIRYFQTTFLCKVELLQQGLD